MMDYDVSQPRTSVAQEISAEQSERSAMIEAFENHERSRQSLIIVWLVFSWIVGFSFGLAALVWSEL